MGAGFAVTTSIYQAKHRTQRHHGPPDEIRAPLQGHRCRRVNRAPRITIHDAPDDRASRNNHRGRASRIGKDGGSGRRATPSPLAQAGMAEAQAHGHHWVVAIHRRSQ